MKLYLDTSVISAMFDERNPERKALTEEFFSKIEVYETYISELTVAKIERTPDNVLKDKMKQVIRKFHVLEINESAGELANEYIKYGAVPETYSEDSYHIAVAVLNEMDYLLSWNFSPYRKKENEGYCEDGKYFKRSKTDRDNRTGRITIRG